MPVRITLAEGSPVVICAEAHNEMAAMMAVRVNSLIFMGFNFYAEVQRRGLSCWGVGLSYNNVGPEYYPRSDSCVTLMMLMSHDVSIILHSLYYF